MTLGARAFGKSPFGGTGVSFAGQDLFIVVIGPNDVTALIDWRSPSPRIQKQLNGRDEFECTLLSSTGYVPALGESVQVYFERGLQFGGSVHERDVEFLTERSGQHTVSKIRCVDHSAIAHRRRVFEVFEDVSAGAIVRFIIFKYLAAEFVEPGDIQEGPLVTRMVANMSVAEALDELSEKSGFFWNISATFVLNFFARTTKPSPFTIDSSNAVFRHIRGSRTRNQYRNVQYVDGGRGVTDPRGERFRGDSLQRTFHVEYPLFKTPMISRNGQPQTVGIRGIDSEKDWYWNAGETAIGQDPLGDLLGANEVLEVFYVGRFNLLQIVEDTSAILERQAVEGGSGRHEQLDRDDQLDGQDLVQDKGLALLSHYGTLDDVAEFGTDIAGLDTGQLLTINVPALILEGPFLITQMDISWMARSTRRFRVTATTGELKGRAEEFFTRLLGSRQSIAIREGEILQEVLATHDPVRVSDSMVMTLIDVVVDEFGPGEFGSAEMGV